MRNAEEFDRAELSHANQASGYTTLFMRERDRRARARRTFHAVVGIATIVGGLVAVLAYVWPRSSEAVSDSRMDEGSVVPTPTQDSPWGASDPQGSNEPTCLDENAETVSCAGHHSYEVVHGATDCTLDEITRYLGGAPSIEVLLVTPEQFDKGMCAVKLPTGWTGLAMDVLSTDNGAALRVCAYPERGEDSAPCSMPHTVESIGAADFSSNDAASACLSATEVYVERNATEILHELNVTGQWVINGTTRELACSVTLRSDGALIDTVRSLGPRALPLAEGDLGD
jgi:hypothetical protein